MQKPKLLDLFSGIGGFSLGFELGGFEVMAHAEIDPYASKVLKKHWPLIPNLGDVRKLCRLASDCKFIDDEPYCELCDDWFSSCPCIGLDEFRNLYGTPDIISLGTPCQDISKAKTNGKGLQGEASSLWFEGFRVVDRLRPNFVLFENVANVVNKGGDRVIADFQSAGYKTVQCILESLHFGGQHKRARAYILSYSEELRIQGMRAEEFKIAPNLAPPILPVRRSNGQWEIEPDFYKYPDGIPSRLDAIRVAGNAVQPQIANMFAQFIYKIIQYSQAP